METMGKLIQMLNTTIKDMNSGGEVSLMHQIMHMKDELKQLLLKKQQNAQSKILSLQEQLKQQKAQFNSNIPPSKSSEVQYLEVEINQLIAEVEKLNKEKEGLINQINELKGQQDALNLSKLSQAQQMEKKVQLYHQLTGVCWEDDQKESVGYVLSEEIAQPIRYDPDGTEQLWEMIDM